MQKQTTTVVLDRGQGQGQGQGVRVRVRVRVWSGSGSGQGQGAMSWGKNMIRITEDMCSAFFPHRIGEGGGKMGRREGGGKRAAWRRSKQQR